MTSLFYFESLFLFFQLQIFTSHRSASECISADWYNISSGPSDLDRESHVGCWSTCLVFTGVTPFSLQFPAAKTAAAGYFCTCGMHFTICSKAFEEQKNFGFQSVRQTHLYAFDVCYTS